MTGASVLIIHIWPGSLDPVDRRIERALLDLKQLVRQLPNALDDAAAVERP